MKFSVNKKKLVGGFTLIETLVGVTVFILIAISVYQAFGTLMDVAQLSKAKIAATTVANEKFEIIRNLPYESVGIPNGIPDGVVERDSTVERDGFSFDIVTTIRNMDDPFDGTIGGSPNDTSPADYKLADLDINCSNCKKFTSLKFVTIIAPRSLETASPNGALFVRVIDNSGQPIQGAEVIIENIQTNPNILIGETTDNDGWIKIVDAPPGVNTYNIIATKLGYSTDQTYPLGGIAGDNPLLPDATVVIQQVTQTSLIIDKLSSLLISSTDALCAPLPSINFSLTGIKTIGTPSILKYNTQNFTTNVSGNLTISDLEFDTYQFSYGSLATYDLVGTNPILDIALAPNENKNFSIVSTTHLDNAILVSVKDDMGLPVDGASVRLEGNSFDETKTTNSGTCPTPGQTFWNGLVSGTYTLTVTQIGYQTFSESIDITTSWQKKDVILTP